MFMALCVPVVLIAAHAGGSQHRTFGLASIIFNTATCYYVNKEDYSMTVLFIGGTIIHNLYGLYSLYHDFSIGLNTVWIFSLFANAPALYKRYRVHADAIEEKKLEDQHDVWMAQQIMAYAKNGANPFLMIKDGK